MEQISLFYSCRLFKRHPEYKEFFKDLMDVNSTDEDAWLNPRFERHMIHVLLPTLGTIVRNVDRPETTREQMIKLGKMHQAKVTGLKRKHIEVSFLWHLIAVTVMLVFIPTFFSCSSR